MGWTGVDLFFVLSGFLITRILLTSKNSRHYFKNFYLRRMLRIFPLYYAALVCGIWLIPAILPETIVQPYLGQSQSHQGWLWSYSVNIARTFMPIVSFGMFSHFWSLAIEEQFYIIWPSVVKWLEPKRLFYVCLSIIAVSLFGRIVCCSMTPDWGVAYMLTIFRLDSLASGSILALLIYTKDKDKILFYFRKAQQGLKILGVLLIVLFFLINPFYPSNWFVLTFGLLLLAVCAACLVLHCINEVPSTKIRTIFSARLLQWFGKYSYGMYVLHFPILFVMRDSSIAVALKTPWPAINGWVFLFSGLLATSLAAWLSYHMLELPFLKMKKYFAY